MTAKDVIEYFKICKSAVETCNEALGLAVEALEKQVPFKPTRIEERKEYNCKFGCCKCGAWTIGSYEYCSKCGQKLNWRG